MKISILRIMFLYYMVIYPIRKILEICFIFFDELTGSPGISVIGLSFVVTLCCLPLYIIAENWQEKQRVQENELKPGIKRIKETFRGDEQFMMLSTFYRQKHYHPLMALRSSFGLLIQIPFFIAAYTFLSRLQTLKGAPFFCIRDMGAPDGLLHIGSLSINVLPVIMTAINCISGAIYTKGHGSIREKVQIYVSALLFLVLLYASPAGLVLYWTMNNLLSLVKNIFYKLKNPVRTFYAVIATAAACGLGIAMFGMKGRKPELRAMLALLCLLILASPLIIKGLVAFIDCFLKDITERPRVRFLVFVLSAVLLAILTGLTIPSMLIESEPQEFCFVDTYTSPFIFLWTPFFQALGLYVFWPLCFYLLFGTRVKKLLTVLFAFLATYALINNFLFTGSYGPMTQSLEFMEEQFFLEPLPAIIINALLAVAALALIITLLTKRASFLIPYHLIIVVCLAGISVRNIAIIGNAYRHMDSPVTRTSIDSVYHLSKTGRNVLIFMQDRLFSPLMDEVFEEKPGLAEHFDGFVFYPNTVSMGKVTMIGVPGIFGGYSFTPAEMNKRTDQTVREKHNEAILSMPVTFLDAGFEATVSDLPYENFEKQPVTEMYRDYPAINRIVTCGAYSDYWYQQNGIEKTPFVSNTIKHSFIMFSIFKTFPSILRRLVYHKRWWNVDGRKDNFSRFIDNYSCLVYFPELFDGDSDAAGTFTMINNLATHEPTLLQYPDYVPVHEVTQTGDSKWAQDAQYNTQAATMRCYAAFFDWLKEQGLYDNTRIIIVSDHGAPISTGKFDNTFPTPFLKEHVTASLLVKDFNDRTPSPDGVHLRTDMTFMTNADTPALATRELIENAMNPFTGIPYAVTDKNEYVKICNPPAESPRIRQHTRLAIPNDSWYSVHDDIFKAENWEQIFPFGK